MIGNKKKEELKNLRKIRAYSILAKGETPEIVDTETYIIRSQSSPEKTYTVTHNGTWRCTCPDWKYHNIKHSTHIKCKHIQSVELWLKLRDKLTNENDIEVETDGFMDKPECVYCHSKNIKKDGMRRNKHGLKQKYKCKDCGKWFVLDKIKGYSANGKIIALTMDLYFKGMSFRKITDILNQHYSLKLVHTTVMRWIHNFMDGINKYTSKLEPNVGDTWHIDEQKIKANGEWFYSWNILDAKTRFLIANTITEQRSILETEMVMKKAKKNTQDANPEVIITDGMPSYHRAIRNEFGNNVTHIGGVGIRDRINNNVLERYHGTYRERDKVMRGLENDATGKQMNENMRTYYNFVRKHSVIGKTPAEEAGINLNLGRNKMLDLMERSMTVECTN